MAPRPRINGRLPRYAGVLVGLLLVGGPLTAAGADGEPVLSGAGATLPAPLYQLWGEDYARLNGVRFDYRSVGSGAAMAALLAGTVDVAATDVPLPELQLGAIEQDLVAIPSCRSTLAVAYNLPITERLRLTPELIAALFAGRLRSWSDPDLARLNPSTPLPDLEVAVVHRSDRAARVPHRVAYSRRRDAVFTPGSRPLHSDRPPSGCRGEEVAVLQVNPAPRSGERPPPNGAHRRSLTRAAATPLGALLGLRRLDEIYLSVRSRNQEPMEPRLFLRDALSTLGVRWEVDPGDRDRIPRTGPLAVVANHPFGGVEGLVLAALLLEVRDDVKLMANDFLLGLPELDPLLVAVDPFETPGAVARNLGGVRASLEWLSGGGTLVVFPAGTVAHLTLPHLRVVDPPWKETVARLVRRSGAQVLPVHVRGRNGAAFQAAGLVHPMLRTALLPRELLNKRGRVIRVSVGAPFPRRRVEATADDRELIALLRQRTELLAERTAPRRAPTRQRSVAVAAPGDRGRLLAEVARLPSERLLVEGGDIRVGWVNADEAPELLHEIGRQREITFRAVGEGTGREVDLDRFDRSYRHLFAWDQAQGRLVGCYRVGPTDRLLATGGTRSLYTSTLFEFDPLLFARLGPMLELGRSFVTAPYQRSVSALHLLWRGIGRLVAREPRYRYLFGPVSISAEYLAVSRGLLAVFLERNLMARDLAGLVRPRHGFRPSRRLLRQALGPVTDLDELTSLITHVEPDQKGIPVLLRQYLKLGAQVLGLNVDPEFSGVLDALVLVDLARTDQRILGRHMGEREAAAFRTLHGTHLAA